MMDVQKLGNGTKKFYNMKEYPSQDIIKKIRDVVGTGTKALHEPTFIGNEIKYLTECINSNYVSSVGGFVNKFENILSKYLKSNYVILTNTGTSALHSSLLCLGINQKHEVLVPTLTFSATANAIKYCGAEPHFIDSEFSTLGVDVNKLREYLKEISKVKNGELVNLSTNKVIKAIIPVHTFGHPVRINELLDLSEEMNIALIEDAAESIGSKYLNKHLGTYGLMGVLSFNGNKTITTGAGGAIITDNERLANKLRHLTTTARVKHKWELSHDQIGYNYRMSNISAAIGLAQMEKIDELIQKKRQLYNKYRDSFRNNKYVDFFLEPNDSVSNFWFQSVILKKKFSNERDTILEDLNSDGLFARPCWKLMHYLEHFKNCPKMDLRQSEDIYDRLINIPSSSNLV